MDRAEMKAFDDEMREKFAMIDLTGIAQIACMKATATAHFDDDEFDDCIGCGSRVRFRPYMPSLPKICMECLSEGEAQ